MYGHVIGDNKVLWMQNCRRIPYSCIIGPLFLQHCKELQWIWCWSAIPPGKSQIWPALSLITVMTGESRC